MCEHRVLEQELNQVRFRASNGTLSSEVVRDGLQLHHRQQWFVWKVEVMGGGGGLGSHGHEVKSGLRVPLLASGNIVHFD